MCILFFRDFQKHDLISDIIVRASRIPPTPSLTRVDVGTLLPELVCLHSKEVMFRNAEIRKILWRNSVGKIMDLSADG